MRQINLATVFLSFRIVSCCIVSYAERKLHVVGLLVCTLNNSNSRLPPHPLWLYQCVSVCYKDSWLSGGLLFHGTNSLCTSVYVVRVTARRSSSNSAAGCRQRSAAAAAANFQMSRWLATTSWPWRSALLLFTAAHENIEQCATSAVVNRWPMRHRL